MQRDSRRRNGSGQDLVEYALVLPFLLLLIFALVELGGIVFQYNAIANAAREGARRGIVVQGDDSTVLAAASDTATARAVASGLDADRLTVQAEFLSGTRRRVRLIVTYQAQLVSGPVVQAIGDGSGGAFTLQAASSMLRE